MDKKVVAAIGIDLGTTYSCVAVWQKDQVEIIPDDQGNRIMPSCVSFTEGGRLIGEGAKNKIITNATNTIYDAKRLIGRRFSDTKVEEDMKSWPFKVIKGTNDIPLIVVEHEGKKKEITAEEISSMILSKLKKVAEDFLGKTVLDAVITVPAYFDDSQRQATKDAGHVAGLNVLQIINEPTSAAIAYGLDNKTNITSDINVLIFDLGGGTFDVSLVTIDKQRKIKVNAVTGDTHLGGQDFDNLMVDHFVDQFNKKYETSMNRNNRKAFGRLRIACEKAKRILSSATETDIEVDCLHQGYDFSTRVTRAKFESLNADLFTKCIQMVESCLGDAKMNKKDVHEVVLVGGSTRIPKVQQLLKDFFNGKELCKKIHADEAVAYGAAVLAAKLTGSYSEKVKHLELVDVVPLSLGLESLGDVFDVMIKRNTQIPAENEEIYVTVEDNQSIVSINVYQGERSIASENNWLGIFCVAVPPAPKGESKVKVVFHIDADGILNCSGEDVTTGIKKKIKITPNKQRLSNEDIKKMLVDAQKYKLEDEEFKEKIYARNALDNYIYTVKSKIKGVRSTGKKRFDKEEMEKMEKAIEDAHQVLSGSKLADADEYKKTLDALEQICFPILARHV